MGVAVNPEDLLAPQGRWFQTRRSCCLHCMQCIGQCLCMLFHVQAVIYLECLIRGLCSSCCAPEGSLVQSCAVLGAMATSESLSSRKDGAWWRP